MHDPESGRTIVKLFSGDCYIATEPGEILDTLVGSCIAACIRDPVAGIGGMNHFLLPGDGENQESDKAARYGAFAMEQLINDIIKAGGCKSRLEVKVFGGGNVTRNSARIGSKNAEFVCRFLAKEKMQIAGSDLEGDLPRRIQYYPDTGRVRMRRLGEQDNRKLMQQESAYRSHMANAPVEGEIDLF